MIPLKLSITGFLSYQQQVNIDFQDVHLACISGANGAGKSSILDAITWVLFGFARSKNDAVINQRCQAAEICLEFEYEHQRYRITRSKVENKPQVLEFNLYHSENHTWRPLTEHNISETQKRIISILRMDYDTFTNASFFLQGKADQFTQLSPGPRKEILSNILGLEVWEEYRIDAREKRRSLEQTQQRYLNLIEEIRKELAEEPEIKQRIKKFKSDLQNAQTLNTTLGQLVEQSKQLQNAKETALHQIENLKQSLHNKNKQRTEWSEKLAAHLDDKQKYEVILNNESEILREYNQWKTYRDQLEEVQNQADQYYKLEQLSNLAKQEINTEEARLKADFRNLSAESEHIQKIQTELPILLEKSTALTEKINSAETLLNQREETQSKLEDLQNQFSTKQSELKQTTLAYQNLRDQYQDFHQAGPECPFCSQPLTPDHREKYEKHLTEIGQDLKVQKTNLETEVTAIQTSIKEYRETLQNLNRVQQEFHQLQNQRTAFQTQITQIQDTIKHWLDNKAAVFKDVSQKLEKENFATEARLTLKDLAEQMKTLGYDVETHQNLKSLEANHRSSENQYRELEIAKAALNPILEQIKDREEAIQLLKQEINQDQTHLVQLETEFDTLYKDIPDSKQLQNELDQNQIDINRLHQFIGAENQKINYLQQKRVDQSDYQQKNDEMVIQISRYQKLEEAFGKNGIPALLIEQALPEIENHANEYLERLTNGLMSIKFQTQSEYKDKKRTDKKETLDILISDQSGDYRAYELFSGGEAFRINFSIRLALSQVLARRAGARLQTLVIDEGFGSQDLEGRQRLVEAINLVQKDFERILVITHLEELKDAFPTRIEVQKTLQGSFVEVTTR
ncbi:MAG: hypothetical protein CL609_14325 [Anaerolineaceae bacterium]|nr:hypothetical protein [Anaerolineaceae bacterium]